MKNLKSLIFISLLVLGCRNDAPSSEAKSSWVSARVAGLSGIMYYPANSKIEKIVPQLSCNFCNFGTCNGTVSSNAKEIYFENLDLGDRNAIQFEFASTSVNGVNLVWDYEACTYEWSVKGTVTLEDGSEKTFLNILTLAHKAAPKDAGFKWNAGDILSAEAQDKYQDFTIDFDYYEGMFSGVYDIFVVEKN